MSKFSKINAYEVIKESRPKHRYRGAVVGCGRMGSTIDDEHIGLPHYPWPWAHAPAMIESSGVELVAGVDLDAKRLQDFGERWGVNGLYSDIEEMMKHARPDIVSVTTRPAERPAAIKILAELGVKAIFATKPLCRSLEEADEIIDVCNRSETLLVIACHLNWYAPYKYARDLIKSGELGSLRSIVCNTPLSLSNIGSHSLSLARSFIDSPAIWAFGDIDDTNKALSNRDLSGSGYIKYQNGVICILNSNVPENSWSIEFLCEKGRVVSRNHHATFELWKNSAPDQNSSISYDIQNIFPNPWIPRSSVVDAIEGVAKTLDGDFPNLCPGEFGREALEIAIAIRESYLNNGVKVDIPIPDRSLKII